MTDTCSVCGGEYQIPENVSFTCPNGHVNVYTSNTNDKLRQENYKLTEEIENLKKQLVDSQSNITYYRIRAEVCESQIEELKKQSRTLKAKCTRLEKCVPAKKRRKTNSSASKSRL